MNISVDEFIALHRSSVLDLRVEREKLTDHVRAQLAERAQPGQIAPPLGFIETIRREMPQNTVIGDPNWWAPKLWRWAMFYMRPPFEESAPSPVSDDAIETALNTALNDPVIRNRLTRAQLLRASSAMRELFETAAVAPDYELVGACVVDKNGKSRTWGTLRGTQEECEANARDYANASGGTPYRLYRGEPITEATP